MPPPSDPAEERSRPSSVTPSPSAYVLLEAELAAGREAERVVWVSRQRPAPRGAVTLVGERDAAVRARVVGALLREPDAERGQVGGPAFDVEGVVGVPEALERLLRGGVAVVLCGDVGPEEDARALHETLRREPAFAAAPAVYFSSAPDAAMAAAHRGSRCGRTVVRGGGGVGGAVGPAYTGRTTARTVGGAPVRSPTADG